MLGISRTFLHCARAGSSLSHVAKISTTPSLWKQLTDFHLRKVTGQFDRSLDTNRDGFVDHKDIESYKRKMRRYMESSLGTAKVTFPKGYEDFWILFHDIADANKDGRLSRDEWIDMWVSIIKNAKNTSFDSLPQWVQLMPDGIFPCIDVKNDGVIHPEEYRKFWSYVGNFPHVEDRLLHHYFDVMTEGGKYEMDLQRTRTLFADFYLSSSPESPGRYIAGPSEYQEDVPFYPQA